MAKKSNKTEQVLKLITKDEETIGKLAPEVVLKEKPAQELKVEAKLTIEIDPEVELKKKDPVTVAMTAEPEKPATAGQPAEPEAPELKIAAEPEMAAEPERAPEPERASEPELAPEPELAAEKKPGRRRLEQGDPLLNLSEILVKEKAPDVIEKMRVCTCEACHNDVLALALNMLPTKYVTTDEGKQFLQLEMYKKQYETDVLSALTRACVRVKASPRH